MALSPSSQRGWCEDLWIHRRAIRFRVKRLQQIRHAIVHVVHRDGRRYLDRHVDLDQHLLDRRLLAIDWNPTPLALHTFKEAGVGGARSKVDQRRRFTPERHTAQDGEPR